MTPKLAEPTLATAAPSGFLTVRRTSDSPLSGASSSSRPLDTNRATSRAHFHSGGRLAIAVVYPRRAHTDAAHTSTGRREGHATLRPMDGPDDDDPVPPGLVLGLEEAFRVLEALEDARFALLEARIAPGLQDELATVIRLLHGRLGLDEGGVL